MAARANLFCVLTFLITWVSCSYAANLSLKSNPDSVPTNYSKLLCAQTPDTQPIDLWKNHIYDAQFVAWQNKQIHSADLEKVGYLSSQKLNCKGADTLQLAFTAPIRLPFKKNKPQKVQNIDFKVLSASLREHCLKSKTLFAPVGIKNPINLNFQRFEQRLTAMGSKNKNTPGSYSVLCRPKKKQKPGWVMWYLFPVGDLKLFADVPEFTKDLDFFTWLNKVRSKMALPKVRNNVELNRYANLLDSNTVQHDRKKLLNYAAKLKKNELILLGENRVQGSSLPQMIWLLWYSPDHRSLLLNAKTTDIGFFLKDKKSTKQSIVFLAGKKYKE